MKYLGFLRVGVIASLTLILFLTSCKSDNGKMDNKVSPELEKFMAADFVGALVNDESYTIDTTTEQVVSTSSRDFYSVSNSDYSKHYTLAIDGDLEANSSVTVECTVDNYEGVTAGTYTMKVVKVDDNSNKVWIWSEKDKTGFVLKFY